MSFNRFMRVYKGDDDDDDDDDDGLFKNKQKNKTRGHSEQSPHLR